jgi:hypothetical protein
MGWQRIEPDIHQFATANRLGPIERRCRDKHRLPHSLQFDQGW